LIPWVSHTVTIKRLTNAITSGKRSVTESTISSDVSCYLQQNPTSEEETPMGVNPQEAWKGFFPFGTSLKSLDEVTDGTTTWRVYAVQDFQQFGFPVVATLEEKS